MPVFAALIENLGPSIESIGLISSRFSSPMCNSMPIYLNYKESHEISKLKEIEG